MLKTLSILVADDDMDDQFLIRQALAETLSRFELASVYNGLQLMDYLYRREVYVNLPAVLPSLILLDINMPILNGFWVLEQLSNDAELHKIPVFVLTTSNLSADKNKALALGASGYYTKPTAFDGLKAIAQEVVKLVSALPVGKARN